MLVWFLNLNRIRCVSMFFVFEGVDGAGKTTQLQLFAEWLNSLGHRVVTCQDPGSTQLGEEVRRLLLGSHQTPIHMRTEMMLFTTARTQLVEEIIKPALLVGQTVVLDRYILSTVVYQGHAGNLKPDEVWTVNRIATDGLLPDVTFVLDLDVQTASQRMGKSLDRMESRGAVYFEKVRQGFIHEAQRWPDRVELIDAAQSVSDMQAEIRQLASGYLARRNNDKI